MSIFDIYKFNNIGIVSVMDWKDAKLLLDEEIKISVKPVQLTKVQDKHVILSIRNIPKEEGFIWIDNLFDYLKNLSFKGKIAFAFFGQSGRRADIQEIYDSLVNGLKDIKNEPVHYYLNPDMYKCD